MNTDASGPWFEGPGAPEPSFDLRRALMILRRRIWVIVAVTLVAAAAGVWWAQNRTLSYEATATIRLRDTQREMAGALAESPGEGLAGRQVDPLLSQMQVLTSRAVAAAVVDSMPYLRLRADGVIPAILTDVQFDSTATRDTILLSFRTFEMVAERKGAHRKVQVGYGEVVDLGAVRFRVTERPDGDHATLYLLTRENGIGRLQSGLRVRPREHTDVVDVNFTAEDPRLAQLVTNQVVQVFQTLEARFAQERSVKRRVFLEEQLRHQESALNEARSALSSFRGRQRAYSTRQRLSTEQAGLSQIQVQRDQLDSERRLYNSLLAQLEVNGSDNQIGVLLSSPGIAANPTVANLHTNLVRLQAHRDSLTAGPSGRSATNPEVQRLDTLIVGTRTKLMEAIRNYLTGLDERIASLDALRARNATAFPTLSATEDEEARLEEQVESARTTVTQLRAEYERARLAEAVELGQVAVVDLAGAPGAPQGIGPIRKMVFAVLLGLVLGCGLAFLLEHLNTSIRTHDQVRLALGVPELAVIPRLPHVTRRRRRRSSNGKGSIKRKEQSFTMTALVATTDGHSVGAEAYRLLRTSLLFAQPAEPPKSIVVTSPAPGDGKSTVAANLAVAFAQQGINVLLVDCDLRRGRLHALFQQPREPGLANMVEGTVLPQVAIRPSSIPNLSLLPTGTLPYAPAEMLGGNAAKEWITQLTNDYSLVIFDTPPVLGVADALLLASQADATLFVVRVGRTAEDEAQFALRQLQSVGARVIGAVMNDHNDSLRHYGKYYYNYQSLETAARR